MNPGDAEAQRKIRVESRIAGDISDFPSKLDIKLENFEFSVSLRLCGEKLTFFRASLIKNMGNLFNSMQKNSASAIMLCSITKYHFMVGADLRVCPNQGEHIGSLLQKSANGKKPCCFMTQSSIPP